MTKQKTEMVIIDNQVAVQKDLIEAVSALRDYEVVSQEESLQRNVLNTKSDDASSRYLAARLVGEMARSGHVELAGGHFGHAELVEIENQSPCRENSRDRDLGFSYLN